MEVARSSFPSVTLGPTSFSFVLVVCVHKFKRRGLTGLGERDIIFQKDGNAEHVQKKLIESYPVLKECGGS